MPEEIKKPVSEETKEPVNFNIDLPDIPDITPSAEPEPIKDTFESAVQWSFLGVGHGGSRLVEAFYKLGYRRVCVINTAVQDLDKIELPETNKLCIGIGGAAKNRRVGSSAVKSRAEDVLDLMRKSFGTKFDRILVCCTAGGGTGSGGFEDAARLANDLAEERRVKKVGDSTKVGLLMALPSNSERDRMLNAWEAMTQVENMVKTKALSPVIVVDNERINTIFRSATLGNVWDVANKSITAMFHLFNRLSVSPTRYTAFDPSDYRDILDSGLLTYGALPIVDTTKDAMAKTVRENLHKNVLCAGMELGKATVAACCFVGKQSVIDTMPAENVDHAYEMLGRLVNSASGATVHRGIYAAERSLSAYTLIGGLPMPKERLDEISRMAGKTDWDE